MCLFLLIALALMDKGIPSQASIDKAVIKTFFNKEPEFPKPKPFTFNGDTGKIWQTEYTMFLTKFSKSI